MGIPRFKDEKGRFEVVLSCRKCGWAVAKDRVTASWGKCPLCGSGVATRRVDYPVG